MMYVFKKRPKDLEFPRCRTSDDREGRPISERLWLFAGWNLSNNMFALILFDTGGQVPPRALAGHSRRKGRDPTMPPREASILLRREGMAQCARHGCQHH